VTARRWTCGAAAAVALADLAQVVALPWAPNHAAALAGAALYTVLAVLVGRANRPATWVLLAMPAVPLTTLAAWAGGLPVPVTPGGPMVGVLALQLAAASGAAALLRR
jgi:hypothetical protein